MLRHSSDSPPYSEARLPCAMNSGFYHNRATTTPCGLAYGKPLFLLSPLDPLFDVLNGGTVGVRNEVGVGLLDDLGRVT